MPRSRPIARTVLLLPRQDFATIAVRCVDVLERLLRGSPVTSSAHSTRANHSVEHCTAATVTRSDLGGAVGTSWLHVDCLQNAPHLTTLSTTSVSDRAPKDRHQ